MLKAALIAVAGVAALGASSPAPPTGQLGLCHADAGSRAAARPPGEAAAPLPVLAGFGDGGYEVERATPAARAQFEWGVRLNHAFNEPEALRAFQAAQTLDPRCALCFWGEAAARAPTINYTIGADEAGRAVAALDRAGALAAGLSPKAQGLIAAERARYVRRGAGWATDPRAYARAADALADRFALDDALQVAAASAHMIAGEDPGPGDWRPGGPDAAPARTRLERVLARNPRFTPAEHFYIHLMEWEREPQRAERYADQLGALAPGAGHLVHMPSHIYYRLGRWEDAALVNTRAADADRSYVERVRPPGGLPDLALHAHNLSFGLAGALMSGDAAQALDLARRMQAQYGPDSFVGARAYLALGTYAPVDAVLALRAPTAPVARGLFHYARGEARARSGDAAGVLAEARAVGDAARAAAGARADGGERAVLDVARLTLEGRAAMLRRDWRTAVDRYRRAAVLREARDPGRDPPLWGWPPRRSLASALLANGDAAGAMREARASLVDFPHDGAALTVLARAEAALRDPAGADTSAEAARAWRGSPEGLRPELI